MSERRAGLYITVIDAGGGAPLIPARVGFSVISAGLLCTDQGVKLEVARL